MNWNEYHPWFHPGEFQCRCGCQLNLHTKAFMDMLLTARKIADLAFAITSGTRCPTHNTASGGGGNSDHLTGEGVDIFCMDSHKRWVIVDALQRAGFKRIGIARSFIHAGTRPDNPAPRMWVYS